MVKPCQCLSRVSLGHRSQTDHSWEDNTALRRNGVCKVCSFERFGHSSLSWIRGYHVDYQDRDQSVELGTRYKDNC